MILFEKLQFLKRIRIVIATVFNTCWTYMPSLIVLLLVYFVCRNLPQSNDIFFLQIENPYSAGLFLLASLFLFYITWYSTDLIGNIKWHKVTEKLNTFYSLEFYQNAALWISYACYALIFTSFLNLHEYNPALPAFFNEYPLIFLTLYMVLLLYSRPLVRLVNRNFPAGTQISIICILLAETAILTNTYLYEKPVNTFMFLLLGYLNILLVHFIKKVVLRNAQQKDAEGKLSDNSNLMHRLFLQPQQFSSFMIFNAIALVGAALYFACVLSIGVAQFVGPIAFILLAFAIILGVINLFVLLSMRIGFNIYVFILVVLLVFGMKETHYVRLIDEPRITNRMDWKEYFNQWIDQFPEEDTTTIPMYFVLADGGANRAAFWSAGIMSYVQDSLLGYNEDFSKSIFCISGTSGGSIGAAVYIGLLKTTTYANIYPKAKYVLQHDFLTPALSSMLSFDYLKYAIPFNIPVYDRNVLLEQALEKVPGEAALNIPDFSKPLSYYFQQNNATLMPIIAFNTTRMQDGKPGVISSIKIDPVDFNQRIDVWDILPANKDLRLSTAAFLSARFPYISPAGRIDGKDQSIQYFVDGGYFDNSGAGFVQELLNRVITHIHAIVEEGTQTKLIGKIGRLRPVIVHLRNSRIEEEKFREPVSPFVNDFASPIKTILGAYNMQTNVNDSRLRNYVRQLNDLSVIHTADYIELNLFDEYAEKKFYYPMNWVLSNKTISMMDSVIKVRAGAWVRDYFK